MKLGITRARGIVPLLDPRRLPPENATVAHNCDLEGAVIAPLKEPGAVATLTGANRKRVYPYNSGWLQWDTDVDVAKSPVADDQYQRIYYTVDGVPKVRGIDGTTEYEWNLGIPKPSTPPTVAEVAKTSVSWTRTWYYQYEDAGGNVTQTGSLTEGAYGGENVHEYSTGRTYRMESVPARTTAASTDRFVIFFDGYDGSTFLGRCYPSFSAYAANSDFEVAGASGIANQINAIGIAPAVPDVIFTITYDSSRSSDYKLDRYYVITYVSEWGEEGPPSDPSARVPVEPVENCQLSAMPTSVAGNYNITEKRIYRTVTGASGTFYFLVATIPIGDATYLDEYADSQITANGVLPSQHWNPPPEDLEGLIAHPMGFLLGFVGNTLYRSELNRPHAWPAEYAQTIDRQIVGLARVGDGTFVATDGQPYLDVGDRPEACILQGVNSTQACVSKRSIATYGDEGSRAVFYASMEGLVSYMNGVTSVVTRGYYSGKDGGRAPWTDLDPENMIGVVHDGRYIGTTPDGTFILRLQDSLGFLTTSEITFQGVHYEIDGDHLYIIVGTALKEWGTGTDVLTLEWTTRRWLFNRPGRLSWGRVTASAYPVTFKLYAGGALVFTKSVTDAVAFRLPELRKDREWHYGVTGTATIYEMLASTSAVEL